MRPRQIRALQRGVEAGMLSRREALMRLAALGVTSSAALSVLAACGGGDREAQTPEGRGATEDPTPGADVFSDAEAQRLNESLDWPSPIVEPGEQVTITVASQWAADFLKRQEQFDAFFTERHPNIQVRRENTPFTEFLQKYVAQAAGGTLPDLMYCHYSWAQNFIRQGTFAGIDDYVSRQRDFARDDFTGPSLSYFERDGGLYGIPYDCGPKMLYFNKDIFDAGNLEYPTEDWTVDDMFDAAVKLTSGEGPEKKFGLSGVPAPIADLAPQHLMVFGGLYLDEDETTCLIHEDGARQALEPWFELLHTHGAVPSPADVQAQQQVEPFGAGLAAMGVNGYWASGTLNRDAQFNWGVAGLPAGPNGRFTSAIGSGYAITSGSSQKDAAWVYLNEFLSSAGQIFMFGSTGANSPSRSSAWQSYIDSGAAPGAELFEEVMNSYATSDGVMRQPTSPEVINTATAIWDQMKGGSVQVEAGLREISDQIDPILADNRG